MKILENYRVILEELNFSNYLEIKDIALEPGIIQFSPADISSPKLFEHYVLEALDHKAGKTALPLIIFDKKNQKYAGSTRFGNIDPKNRVLHIGWTWLGRDFRGTGLNKNVKYLMLEHAFETMLFEKVEFRIDERNTLSRKAVESIGASLEGILRKNVVMTDGFRRNTCCYGILKEEWPAIKESLQAQLNKIRTI